MPIVATVSGPAESVTVDICRELVKRIPWAEYGETVIPIDTLGQGIVSNHDSGSVAVRLRGQQPAPDYADSGETEADVRLMLEQPITTDADDRLTFINRRMDVREVLSLLTGPIGA